MDGAVTVDDVTVVFGVIVLVDEGIVFVTVTVVMSRWLLWC